MSDAINNNNSADVTSDFVKKYREEKEAHKARIPELTEKYKKEGREILDESVWDI